jgi:2-polyprenyl-3-methyl-5-hydroxy-6-metoxy-1,4-benzoquinol methylase
MPPGFLLEKMQLAPNLSGTRALDIGPSDGFFSMHLRRRGAEVVAIDYRPKELHGFGVMAQRRWVIAPQDRCTRGEAATARGVTRQG